MANFEFKPFDKVLVRNRWSMWIPAFYGMKSESKHLTSAGWQDECIPYEGNEEYLGTSNNYVDKVSKFKVGDWLVENEPNNYARFVQILEIVDIQGKNRYRISRDLHNDEDVAECRFVEKYYHPFNIQDAKDGDVLHSIGCHNDCIFIFDRLDNWKFDEPNGDRAVATGHCCFILSADNMEFGIQGPDCIEVVTIKPANKILRDLLFQKMKEAGYEWDADKKELKKIEKKPWSEDDETMVNSIISFCDFKVNIELHNESVKEASKKVLSWLKELKDKVQLQPKQEWSEEDRIWIDRACMLLNELNDLSNLTLAKIPSNVNEIIERLKSLRPNHWKPSEEQINALRVAIGDEQGSDCCDILRSLLKDLKSL